MTAPSHEHLASARHCLSALLRALLVPVCAVLAGEPVSRLDTVVVTSSRKSRTLLDTPGAVTVITAEDIRNSGASDLASVIARVPGVSGEGSTTITHLDIRGTQTTLSGGPSVYVDGRRFDFGKFGYHKLDDIPLESVERVEVIKSPPSSLYGSNAGRGLIRVYTKKGSESEEAFGGSLTTAYGSWDTYKVSGHVGGRSGVWDYSGSTNYESSGGYRHRNIDLLTLDGEVGYNLDAGIRLSARAGANVKDQDYPLEFRYPDDLDHDRRKDDPWASGKSYRTVPDHSEQELHYGGVGLTFDRDDWQGRLALDVSRLGDLYSNLNELYSTSSRSSMYTEDRDESGTDLALALGRTLGVGEAMEDTLTIGYDYRDTAYRQDRMYTRGGSVASVQRNTFDYDRAIHGFSAHNELDWLRLNLQSGVRWDVVRTGIDNEYPVDPRIHDKMTAFSWNVSPSYHLTDSSNLYLNLGKSFWYPPSFYISYIFSSDHVSEADIRPEEYTTAELGFKHRLSERINYSIGVFRTEAENHYVAVYDGVSTAFRGFRAVGSSVHRGVEAECDGRLLPWLGYRCGFSCLSAEWDDAFFDGVDISGNDVQRVPRYQYTAGLTFTVHPRLTVAVDARGESRQFVDARNEKTNDSFLVVDARISYELSDRVKGYLLCSNVFDHEHEVLVNTTGRSSTTRLYPIDGRYIETGLRWSF